VLLIDSELDEPDVEQKYTTMLRKYVFTEYAIVTLAVWGDVLYQHGFETSCRYNMRDFATGLKQMLTAESLVSKGLCLPSEICSAQVQSDDRQRDPISRGVMYCLKHIGSEDQVVSGKPTSCIVTKCVAEW
jgi:hypothetical protein